MSYRLFVAIRPPKAIQEALLAIMHGIAKARWQNDSQLHLTLRYIGDVEAHAADDIADSLANIHFDPFALRIASVGYFEDKATPRTLWAGIAACDALSRLQQKVERACQRAGLPPENRKFTPHITLARLNTASGSITDFITHNSNFTSDLWPVEDFAIYESELHPLGSIYTPAITYPARR